MSRRWGTGPVPRRCSTRPPASPARPCPPGHSVTTRLELNLADLYASQARYKLAEPLLLGAIATQRAQLGDNHPTTRRSVGTLIEHYRARGMDETAAAWASGRR